MKASTSVMRALLAVVCWLLSVVPVSAECAWVVWEMSQIQSPSNPQVATRAYGIMGARGTESECRDMSDAMNEMLKPDKPEIIMYYCLPDTVDPRGPTRK